MGVYMWHRVSERPFVPILVLLMSIGKTHIDVLVPALCYSQHTIPYQELIPWR